MRIIRIILFVSLVSPIIARMPQPEKWTLPEKWRHNLSKGMTERQVIGVLGQPMDEEVKSSAMIWYYQEPVTRIDGKIINRPDCGLVRFRAKRTTNRTQKPIYLVFNWNEPNWPKVQAELKVKELEQAQAAEQAKAERLAIAQARRETREQLINESQQRREKLNAERRSAYLQKENERMKQRQIELENREVQTASPKKVGFKFNGFFCIGIVFLFLAFILTIFYRKSWH